MKKIILFGSQITVGGAQRVLLDQSEWFRAKGYDVRAVFFYDKDGLLEQWREKYSFPIETLAEYHRNGNSLKNLANVIKGFFRLIALLRREKADVIECFTHDANLIGLPAAFLASVPCRIGTHHGQFAGMKKIVRTLHTAVCNSAITSKLVCVSARAEKQALEEGMRQEKISVIFNGVHPITLDTAIRDETRAELGLTAQQRMILNVGRLVPEKAQVDMIHAAGVVCGDEANAQFFIAGAGPLSSVLREEIDAMGLWDRFTLLGNRDDVNRLLNAADIFVLCSVTEGMPVSLMEAMSAGLPIAASNLEGIAQLIPNERFGTLFSPGDYIKQAMVLLELLWNPDKAKAQGNAARQRILDEFSLNASCHKYEELFKANSIKKKG